MNKIIYYVSIYLGKFHLKDEYFSENSDSFLKRFVLYYKQKRFPEHQ